MKVAATLVLCAGAAQPLADAPPAVLVKLTPAADAFGSLGGVEATGANAGGRLRGSSVPAPEAPEDGDARESAGTPVENDPRYPEQWHYHQTGQVGGTPMMDIDWASARSLG